METKKFFYQNDQRKMLYKNRYKRKFLGYPCYPFMCKNKKDQAFLGPHCKIFIIINQRCRMDWIGTSIRWIDPDLPIIVNSNQGT